MCHALSALLVSRDKLRRLRNSYDTGRAIRSPFLSTAAQSSKSSDCRERRLLARPLDGHDGTVHASHAIAHGIPTWDDMMACENRMHALNVYIDKLNDIHVYKYMNSNVITKS